jgi:molecular chaperone HtpG
MQRGSISVSTENIFPIIKKFLYSDQEIFLRELVANAIDATTKLKTYANKGEVEGELGDTRIEILLDKEAKTITIRDKGIGMTGDEVQKYLNQVAFSSAQEFLEKYQSEANIIGHFGLGFYSAFMVADKVEVVTKSYKTGSQAVRWTCDGSPEYTLEEVEKEGRGTDIILHVGADGEDFLEKSKLDELLNKYCKFLPTEIQFGTKTEYLDEAEDSATEDENGEDKPAKEPQSIEVPNIINDTNPLWKRNPAELTDQDYQDFYQKLHPHSQTPLFWVHLNIDYPFNLTGVLYFPKLGNQLEVQRNKIQLYCNQVFVTDEVKEIVPEFLTLLHGVIDSPDIPLNVSRSYLQSDRNVKRISEYITRKVADKLGEMFKKERDIFTSKWESTNVFVKYGMVTDEKFAEKAMKFTLLENTQNQYFTLEEYKEKIATLQTDKDGKLIYLYSNDTEAHDGYIQVARNNGYDVLKFDSLIDTHFIQHLERKLDKVSFSRVDADSLRNLIKKDDIAESILTADQQKSVETLFKDAIDDSKATVSLQALTSDDMPVMVTKPEFFRRMREMQFAQGQSHNLSEFYHVVVNTNHPTIVKLASEPNEAASKHLYQLALLHQGMLKGAELTEFVKKSVDFIK